MKMLKKLFGRLTAHDTPPPVRPAPTPVEDIQDPRYAYRREQADFRRRAKAVTTLWTGSTCYLGRNKAKRERRAEMESVIGRRWKKSSNPPLPAGVGR